MSEINLGGLKAVWLTLALPVLSGISGAIYFGYDAIKRFEIVEESNGSYSTSISELSTIDGDFNSRIQSLEQAMQDNDVRGLAPKLSEISTQMETILEQQKELLDLRSKIEKAETITDGLGDKLDKFDTEIEDLWKAFDEAVKNPLK
jgi:predicted  nucleic acid-binding Zn-ribbon protein